MVLGFVLEFHKYLWSFNINVKPVKIQHLPWAGVSHPMFHHCIKYDLVDIVYIFSPSVLAQLCNDCGHSWPQGISHKPVKEEPLDFLQCSLLKLKMTAAALQPLSLLSAHEVLPRETFSPALGGGRQILSSGGGWTGGIKQRSFTQGLLLRSAATGSANALIPRVGLLGEFYCKLVILRAACWGRGRSTTWAWEGFGSWETQNWIATEMLGGERVTEILENVGFWRPPNLFAGWVQTGACPSGEADRGSCFASICPRGVGLDGI